MKINKIKRLQNYIYKINSLKKHNKIPKDLKEDVKLITALKPKDVNPKDLNKYLEKAKYIASPTYRVKKKTRGQEARVKELKAELKIQVKKLKENELRLEAKNRLMGKPKDASQLGEPYYKKLKFRDIYEKGLTVIDRSGKATKIYGIKAVNYQIKSLRRNNDPEWRKMIFVRAYLSNLREVGIDNQNHAYLYRKIRATLNALEPKEITFLLNTNYLPEISFYYVLDESDIQLLNEKFNAIKENASKWRSELAEMEKKEDEMMNIIEAENKLKGNEKKETTWFKNY